MAILFNEEEHLSDPKLEVGMVFQNQGEFNKLLW